MPVPAELVVSAGLKPVIIGSSRACWSGGSERNSVAMTASVNEGNRQRECQTRGRG